MRLRNVNKCKHSNEGGERGNVGSSYQTDVVFQILTNDCLSQFDLARNEVD